MKRLHQVFDHDKMDNTSVHWRMLKHHVLKTTGMEPFAQVEDIGQSGFRYLASDSRSDRFEILEGDAPYSVSAEWLDDAATYLPEGGGPVEIDVAAFMLDPKPELGVLIGGMGSGKSTTVRQIARWLKPTLRAHCLNCDQVTHDPQKPRSATELLVKFLDPLVSSLVDVDEEFGPCWDWAFALYGQEDATQQHSALTALQPAVTELKREYAGEWRRSDPDAVTFRRRELRSKVCVTYEDTLNYYALLIDFHLTVRCGRVRNSICIVLDNIDPFPPRLQRELLLRSSELQKNANCKVILAMRPLTYSLTKEQRGQRVVKVIQHIGPSALSLIEDRVQRLIVLPSYSALRLRAIGKHGERELLERDFKDWVRQVIEDIKASRAPGGPRSNYTSAQEFIEGLCNNSLRSALLVAEKIFGSPNLPMVLPDEPLGEVPHMTILKNHEIIRAVLLGKHAHFVSDINRVTDNIFDLGDATTALSLTCKYRILRELAYTPGRGILPLLEVRKRLARFDYDDETIKEGVNGIISQIKRLAWSDMVTSYDLLDEAPHSRLSISRAGRFYVDHAIYSLEYVQEVHVDVLLPEQMCAKYSHGGFSDRVNSVYNFIRHLHDVDHREVLAAMSKEGGAQAYFNCYGTQPFSSEVGRSLQRQVTNIGNSMLRRMRPDDSRYAATRTAVERWSTLDNLLAREDEAIVMSLEKLRAL
jgi:hypothetical protein